MTCGRTILIGLLAFVLAACGGRAAPPGSSDATRTDVADVADVATPNTSAAPMTSPMPTYSPRILSPSPASRSAPSSAPNPVPPKPVGVKFDEKVLESDDGSMAKITQTVRWRTPRCEGVEIRVYGVTECIARPRDPAPNTSGLCLVTRTALPASVRTLLGRAPASAGLVSWSWTEETGCDIGLANDPGGPTYDAIVLAAYNVSGNSIFAIAEPGDWWQPGPNDVVC
jgi:hypothetical protein